MKASRSIPKDCPTGLLKSNLRLQIKKNVTIFLATLTPNYNDFLINQAGASFSNLEQTAERVEDGLKIEKIKDYQILFEQAFNSTKGSTVPTKRNRRNGKGG